MQSSCVLSVFLLALAGATTVVQHAKAHDDNPLSRTIVLLDSLTAKVTKEGIAEAKAYRAYTEWCDETSHTFMNEITTAKSSQEKLEARIAQLTADIEASTSKIDELAYEIRINSADLAAATGIRNAENNDFSVSEAELNDSINTLTRAIDILAREMQKNPANFAQFDNRNMASLVQSLNAVIDAASFTSSDRQKLLTMVQTQKFAQAQRADADDDDMPNAPAAVVYKTHSVNVLDTLEELKEKAEEQLADLRKVETQNVHNFRLLKKSLEDEIAADTKNMNDEKASRAAAEEAKAEAEADLARTLQELKIAQENLATTQANCIRVGADHEQSVRGESEELTAIQKARSVLQDTTSGAVSQSYSLIQVVSRSRMATRMDLAGSEVLTMVRKLAKDQGSPALTQLASRMAAVLQFGVANGVDPFAKVKGLLETLIAKLEREAEQEATQKAYCDEYTAKTEFKISELDDDISRMTSKIDVATARSAQLQEQIGDLQNDLSALASEQAEMDKIRQENHADYEVAKADLEQGLTGVRAAMRTLRSYYGSAALVQQPAEPVNFKKAAGAGDSIISILEVVESDFATSLAQAETAEADQKATYDKTTQENRVEKEMKDQDVKYKTQERKQKDKTITEISADRDATNSELASVNTFYTKLKAKCTTVPETYADRQRRRQAEIQGLKDALTVLDDETAAMHRKDGRFVPGALAQFAF